MTIEFTKTRPELPSLPKTCSWGGCGRPSVWQIGLRFFGVLDGRKYPVDADTSVTICAECRPKITIEHMMTDDGWKMVSAGFRMARKLQPTRELTELRFLPILRLEA